MLAISPNSVSYLKEHGPSISQASRSFPRLKTRETKQALNVAADGKKMRNESKRRTKAEEDLNSQFN